MSFAAGIGSMPGEDFDASLRMVAEATPKLIAIPELPDRGVSAGMTGRAMGLLAELGADLQPAGWRLTGGGGGVDQRRARSLLGQDLDTLEEQLQGFMGLLKVQVAGPMTLAATVERPRGDRIIADHGARRDLAQSLAEGVRDYLADVARRTPGATLILQIDEPSLDAILTASIPTASGWGRHRAVQVAEVDAALRMFSELAHDANAKAVVHSCACEVPIGLIAGAGFDALSFDARSLDVSTASDEWAEHFDRGLDLWPGIVPSVGSDTVTESGLISRLDSLLSRWGFDVESVTDRLVVTPSCGLAGATPDWARKALGLCANVAAR